MRLNINFYADGIGLRLIGENDLPLTREWRNNARHSFFHSEIITPREHKVWWDQYQKIDDDYFFIIEKDGIPSGCVSIYDINNEDAEYGRCLVPEEFSGQGIMEKGSRLLFLACKEILNLKRLFLLAKADNMKAIHVYDKLGFMVKAESDANLLMEKIL